VKKAEPGEKKRDKEEREETLLREERVWPCWEKECGSLPERKTVDAQEI